MNTAKKNVAWAVGLMLLGTAVGGAQPTSAPPAAAMTSTNAVGPKIQFATPIYDFGRVRAGELVKHTYAFTNTGDRLLIINSVQPGCHCTTAGEWTKQVEPGQTGGIPIQFDTVGNNGLVVRQVTVACNITNQPPSFLQLRGTVYRPIDFNPPMAMLNLPPDGEAASVVVTITNNTDEPLTLFAPEINNRMFTAELTTNTPGKGFQLKVSVVPPVSMGYVAGQINLRTGWTNPAVVTFPVGANVQPAIMVIPAYVTLAAGPLAAAVTNSITIQNNSTNAVQLSEPAVNVPGVEAQIKEMQPGKSFIAMLAFPQGFEIPRGMQVALSVKSSNPRFPVVKVPIMQLPRPVMPPPAAVPVALPRPRPPVVAHPPPPLPPLPAGH
jgi:copper(I)-binding protein